MRWLSTLTVFSLMVLASSRPAAADEALDGGQDSGLTAASSNGEPKSPPLACNGALCDTTNGSTCAIAKGSVGITPFDVTPVATVISILALGAARRSWKASNRPGVWPKEF